MEFFSSISLVMLGQSLRSSPSSLLLTVPYNPLLFIFVYENNNNNARGGRMHGHPLWLDHAMGGHPSTGKFMREVNPIAMASLLYLPFPCAQLAL